MKFEYICNDCPRKCNVLRVEDKPSGFCMSTSLPGVYRAAPHFGEEPCISGTKGSGTVFFSGCNLKCIFCQNHEISRRVGGKQLDMEGLRDVFLRLRDTGVHNINLVTPTHYSGLICKALEGLELGIPVVWNSSGYESVETLKRLEGLVQIYMPDYKYADASIANRYSVAEDYPSAAANALEEMFRQVGPYRLDENGIMKSGLLVRHLILPGAVENSLNVLDYIAESFPKGSILFSLMSQYTPMPSCVGITELERCVSTEEFELVRHYMETRGIEDGFVQDLASATDEMIPAFDLTGVENH